MEVSKQGLNTPLQKEGGKRWKQHNLSISKTRSGRQAGGRLKAQDGGETAPLE